MHSNPYFIIIQYQVHHTVVLNQENMSTIALLSVDNVEGSLAIVYKEVSPTSRQKEEMAPSVHSLVEGFNLNVGACETSRLERQYPLLARLEYLCRYSEQSKSTFLQFFEKYFPEKDGELLKENIKLCFEHDDDDNPTNPKDSQGRIAESLLAKKKTKHFFALMTPLNSMQCLLIPNLDIGTL